MTRRPPTLTETRLMIALCNVCKALSDLFAAVSADIAFELNQRQQEEPE